MCYTDRTFDAQSWCGVAIEPDCDISVAIVAPAIQVLSKGTMARVMPPDGLCLYHAVRYAQNPRMYDSVATAQNAELQRELVAACVSSGLHERANRLSKPGSEGYPEEEDFAMLARIASIPFEIIIDSAPNMQPIKYGDGSPRARFILKLISDDAGHQSAHWDVDALYDQSTKRRRITGKTASIHATAAPGASADVSSDLLGAADIDTARSPAEIRLGPGQGPGVDL